MKGKHSISFYMKQKSKMEDNIAFYDQHKERQIQALQKYVSRIYPEKHSIVEYDLMRYSMKRITRDEFCNKYSKFMDKTIYPILIEYGITSSILEDLLLKYRLFIKNVKELYPEAVI